MGITPAEVREIRPVRLGHPRHHRPQWLLVRRLHRDWRRHLLLVRRRQQGCIQGRDRVLEEIGKRFGLTRERIRQIEEVAQEGILFLTHRHFQGDRVTTTSRRSWNALPRVSAGCCSSVSA